MVREPHFPTWRQQLRGETCWERQGGLKRLREVQAGQTRGGELLFQLLLSPPSRTGCWWGWSSPRARWTSSSFSFPPEASTAFEVSPTWSKSFLFSNVCPPTRLNDVLFEDNWSHGWRLLPSLLVCLHNKLLIVDDLNSCFCDAFFPLKFLLWFEEYS